MTSEENYYTTQMEYHKKQIETYGSWVAYHQRHYAMFEELLIKCKNQQEEDVNDHKENND